MPCFMAKNRSGSKTCMICWMNTRKTIRAKKRDWRTYEQQYALRLRRPMRQPEPLVDEACDIRIVSGAGRRHGLTLKQRVTLLLLQRLFGESNRTTASTPTIFCAQRRGCQLQVNRENL